VDFERRLLYLPKLREGIKIELHRKFDGKIKSVTVSRTNDGKYFASILIETENPRNKVVEPKSRACGIDLGLEHFVNVTNDFGSYKVEHPEVSSSRRKKTKETSEIFLKETKRLQKIAKRRG
jgi:putative transposase